MATIKKAMREKIGNEVWSGRFRQVLEREYSREVADAMVELIIRSVG